MDKNTVYKVTMPMDATCLEFQKGHRIRLSVTSSEFPRYGRNNNTGNSIDSDTEIRVATNSVHHGAAYPSRLLLPTQ